MPKMPAMSWRSKPRPFRNAACSVSLLGRPGATRSATTANAFAMTWSVDVSGARSSCWLAGAGEGDGGREVRFRALARRLIVRLRFFPIPRPLFKGAEPGRVIAEYSALRLQAGWGTGLVQRLLRARLRGPVSGAIRGYSNDTLGLASPYGPATPRCYPIAPDRRRLVAVSRPTSWSRRPAAIRRTYRIARTLGFGVLPILAPIFPTRSTYALYHASGTLLALRSDATTSWG